MVSRLVHSSRWRYGLQALVLVCCLLYNPLAGNAQFWHYLTTELGHINCEAAPQQRIKSVRGEFIHRAGERGERIDTIQVLYQQFNAHGQLKLEAAARHYRKWPMQFSWEHADDFERNGHKFKALTDHDLFVEYDEAASSAVDTVRYRYRRNGLLKSVVFDSLFGTTLSRFKTVTIADTVAVSWREAVDNFHRPKRVDVWRVDSLNVLYCCHDTIPSRYRKPKKSFGIEHRPVTSSSYYRLRSNLGADPYDFCDRLRTDIGQLRFPNYRSESAIPKALFETNGSGHIIAINYDEYDWAISTQLVYNEHDLPAMVNFGESSARIKLTYTFYTEEEWKGPKKNSHRNVLYHQLLWTL